MTTHDMFDIEALASRLLLIGKGKLLYDGTVQGLRSRYGGKGGTAQASQLQQASNSPTEQDPSNDSLSIEDIVVQMYKEYAL